MSSIGSSPARPDGRAKAVGAAVFTDDLALPGMLHGATVRSPHARARIVGIDASGAVEDAEVTVFTAADLPGPNSLKLIEDDWRVLAEGEVRHVGEAVAVVAAPTRARALAAASRVRVEYEELPAVTSLQAALEAGGEVPVLAACAINDGDVDAALESADVVVEDVYETGHQEHAYIEPHAMLAIPREGGAMEVVGSLQCPYYVQKALEPVLESVCKSVTVRQVTTGGGFGGKEDYPDMIGAHAALLAWKTERPVKIAYDRHEDIVATTKRHPSRIRHRTGVNKDGTLVAMDIEVILDGGAYVTLSPVVLSRGVLHAAGPYRCPNVRVRGRVLATNTAPNGAFRGFGAPQVQFAMERQMDLVARKVGLDPLALRLKNAYWLGDSTATGQVLEESVSALEALETGATRAEYLRRHAAGERAQRERDEDDPTPMRGIGLSLSWHGSGFTGNGERLLQARAAVELREDGLIHVLTSSTDFGQGTSAVLAQIVADAAGVTVDQVCVEEPSTATVPDSGPTVASRTVMIVGGVLERAAKELARQRHHGQVPLRVEAQYEPGDGAAFDEATYRGTAYPAYGWGCHVVEVAVDPDTLEVTPLTATLVFDVGKAIHPVLCQGQVEGGSLQGFAYGYLEEVKLDAGRYLNDRLSTYIIPTIKDAPRMDTVLLENATAAGPSGAKGVGELPLDGAAPALLAAIENATGIRATSLPATPERLLALLQDEAGDS